jgi:hypothetical protein
MPKKKKNKTISAQSPTTHVKNSMYIVIKEGWI